MKGPGKPRACSYFAPNTAWFSHAASSPVLRTDLALLGGHLGAELCTDILLEVSWDVPLTLIHSSCCWFIKSTRALWKSSSTFQMLEEPFVLVQVLYWDSRLCECPEELGWVFFPRISSGSQFIRYYQGLDSSETFANGLEFCLEPGSGSAKDVTAILGFEEPIHPRVLCQWEWELQQCRKDQWP